MAVRVTGVGEDPAVRTYADADGSEVMSDDHLRVSRGEDVVAVFHRNHWSRAEFLDAPAKES